MAIGLIVVSAHHAARLAHQQVEFVAAVSHELRTPVSVIGAAAGNLADGIVADPARVKTYGHTIQAEARRLAETVERVLQLAGIMAGRSMPPDTLAPEALVDEAIAACRYEIDAAGTQVEVDVPADLPPVSGDLVALRSALQNLVSNAIKYSGDARWVRVSARATGQGSGEMVEFAVEDRGLGIHADERARIFEAFSRGRAATDRQIQGSGLGLNLVQRIADAHGGSVSVSSEPGRGSAFTLRLPAARGTAQGGAADAGARSAGNLPLMAARVLLVEDEPGLQLVGERSADRRGVHVETAGDGDTALRRASGEPFDLHPPRRDAARAERARRRAHAAGSRACARRFSC